MLKGLTSDLTGTADICRPVRDLSKALAVDYLLPGETLHFALNSAKEEFAFTNMALIACVGATATTTRKLVTRYDYKTDKIDEVEFETAGRVDRDVEIKFIIGGYKMSIDIAKDEIATAVIYYKVIELLSREQRRNLRAWDLAKTAMGHAAEALRLSEAGGFTLTSQSDEALTWLQAQYDRFNPRCYRDVIGRAFESVQSTSKVANHP
jgi:hypothetical protein